MNPARSLWRVNIPQLLELVSYGLDDADVDACGNIHICDSINRRVYKFTPQPALLETYDIQSPGPSDSCCMKLAVYPSSAFCVAHPGGGLVTRYDEAGTLVGEIWTPGVSAICRAPEDGLYVFSDSQGIERIERYSAGGDMMDVLPAPPRHGAPLDPDLAHLDSDSEGNVYVCYGMPPYHIWRVSADGADITDWIRPLTDYPEDVILVADMASDCATDGLWVLLAFKETGLQVIDYFDPEGEYCGSVGAPQAENLYGVICASGGQDLYLLDTGTGPGSGDLVRALVIS